MTTVLESSSTRAAWKGVLEIDPSIINDSQSSLGSITYHLRAGKTSSDLPPVKVVKIDSISNREVFVKEVVSQQPANKTDPIIYKTADRKYFFKDEFESNGKLVEVPSSQIVERQSTSDGELIEPFDRTSLVQVNKDSFVGLERVSEYKFKEVYQLAADIDKKIREDSDRVMKLARTLMEKQMALVAFFSWGRGYQYYTAVVHPYERKDGKLWLLMGLSEGKLVLDEAWSLQKNVTENNPLPEVPLVSHKSKPRVSISK